MVRLLSWFFMLFTFVLDYKGGTYSQVRADSAKEAATIWAKELDTKPIAGLRSKLVEQLQQEVEEGAPVPLAGLKNVWCTSAHIKHEPMLINIIQTSEV